MTSGGQGSGSTLITLTNQPGAAMFTGGPYGYQSWFDFNPSRVVPTGPENSPQTLSTVIWRRIS